MAHMYIYIYTCICTCLRTFRSSGFRVCGFGWTGPCVRRIGILPEMDEKRESRISKGRRGKLKRFPSCQ